MPERERALTSFTVCDAYRYFSGQDCYNNNNNNAQDDIYSAVYTAPAMCESSHWVIWTKVGQRQVAAKS